LAISKEDMMRDFILQNCEEVFTKLGYKNTSMDMVAEKCGISKPTLYNYFKSKYSLFMDLYDRLEGELMAKAKALMIQGKDKYQTIEEIIDISLSLVQQKRDFLKMMIREHHLIVHENIDEHLQFHLRKRHEIIIAFGLFLKDIIRPEVRDAFGTEMVGAILNNLLEGAFWASILGDFTDNETQKKFIMKLLKNGILE
jgi:TetR/AcrR family transcriptional regulator